MDLACERGHTETHTLYGHVGTHINTLCLGMWGHTETHTLYGHVGTHRNTLCVGMWGQQKHTLYGNVGTHRNTLCMGMWGHRLRRMQRRGLERERILEVLLEEIADYRRVQKETKAIERGTERQRE